MWMLGFHGIARAMESLNVFDYEVAFEYHFSGHHCWNNWRYDDVSEDKTVKSLHDKADKSEEKTKKQKPIIIKSEKDDKACADMANVSVLVPATRKYRKKKSSPSELLWLLSGPQKPKIVDGNWARQCVSINSFLDKEEEDINDKGILSLNGNIQPSHYHAIADEHTDNKQSLEKEYDEGASERLVHDPSSKDIRKCFEDHFDGSEEGCNLTPTTVKEDSPNSGRGDRACVTKSTIPEKPNRSADNAIQSYRKRGHFNILDDNEGSYLGDRDMKQKESQYSRKRVHFASIEGDLSDHGDGEQGKQSIPNDDDIPAKDPSNVIDSDKLSMRKGLYFRDTNLLDLYSSDEEEGAISDATIISMSSDDWDSDSDQIDDSVLNSNISNNKSESGSSYNTEHTVINSKLPALEQSVEKKNLEGNHPEPEEHQSQLEPCNIEYVLEESDDETTEDIKQSQSDGEYSSSGEYAEYCSSEIPSYTEGVPSDIRFEYISNIIGQSPTEEDNDLPIEVYNTYVSEFIH